MSDTASTADIPVDSTDDPDDPARDAVGDDIRLLGRLLGDAIEQTEGRAVFELVEQVRRLAVDARRSGRSAVDDIRAVLARHPLDEQILVLRALDWMSLLANTAEDVHLERRRRHHQQRSVQPRPGSLAAVLERVREFGVTDDELADAVGALQVSPVITAHPTEVRRKTVLEVLDQLSGLLDDLDVRRHDPGAVDRIHHDLSVCVLLLWQTALLRLSKLRVRDEINEAIRYYDTSLFEVIPALTRDLANGVTAGGDVDVVDTSTSITMGSWIGGDRDGNPFVTADVVRYAIGRQSETALAHHLNALYALSRRLSMT
ncbi:MAG TPA: phosphoenolpyruvate carboxylase, partial [Ilumatobacteraceae bacterium]|nr:phosphoenolpyruvate carboxylase [Ilumatobacteraceae bacterium]